MKNTLIALLTIVCIYIDGNAQDKIADSSEISIKRKGKMYIYWGWNRSKYTNSDIHFKGENYDFTIENASAKDKQNKIGFSPFLDLGQISIPQTNFRIGYFINDKYDISLGVDHMKYVLRNDQTATINGFINLENGSNYNGVYNNDPTKITEDLVAFEHTDGLNYINAEINRHHDFTQYLLWNPEKVAVTFLAGGGLGVLFPKTNTQLLGKERYDAFHVSGFGVSGKIGFNITFFDHCFLQSEMKGGYINMPWIRTTTDSADSASQDFLFYQYNIVFGYQFNL